MKEKRIKKIKNQIVPATHTTRTRPYGPAFSNGPNGPSRLEKVPTFNNTMIMT
jgi:hypothetical protein